MLRFLLVAALMYTLIPSARAMSRSDARPELETVPYVDLNRYLGKWYEIASFPQSFQKDCFATTATYSLRTDGDIDVLNECHKGSVSGPISQARAHAWIVDPATNAKLKVRFFWPFSGDYWIIDLGTNYEYAVVGHPNRKYLWILSRTPTLDNGLYQAIVARVQAKGFDINRLQKTVH